MDLDEMVTAYAICALWSSLHYHTEGEEPEPMDDYATVDDISPELMAEFRANCEAFRDEMIGTLEKVGSDAGQTGHDFWLTRNGHGAGFWDRGYGADGETLSQAAKAYGSVDLWIDADGKVQA